MIDLTRYAVMVEAEALGHEELPVPERQYMMISFKEGFTSLDDAQDYASNVALAQMQAVWPRRVKILLYTLRPTHCETYFADELVKEDEGDIDADEREIGPGDRPDRDAGSA